MNQPPDGGVALEVLLIQPLVELIGEVDGKLVLDAGCGEGRFSRMLAERGAKVTGVDHSVVLIDEARARQQEQPPKIAYVNSSITEMRGVEGDFDLAITVLVLNMLPELVLAVEQLVRRVRPGGAIVVCLAHPCFDQVGPGWTRLKSGQVVWCVDRYGQSVEGLASHGAATYHRPLSVYTKAFFDTGCVLVDLREPIVPEYAVTQLPPEYLNWIDHVDLVIMKFQKLTSRDRE